LQIYNKPGKPGKGIKAGSWQIGTSCAKVQTGKWYGRLNMLILG